MGEEQQLPEYQSHKRVRAAKIVQSKKLDDGTFQLELELPSSKRFFHIYSPPGRQVNAESFVGGYLVRYEDGYESWSPAKAFEEGYKLG